MKRSKMMLVASLVFLALCSISYAQCDKVEARRILDEFKDIFGLEYESLSHTLHVNMTSHWYDLPLSKKYEILNAIANLDACIHGKARHIYINVYNKRVAEKTPMKGSKVFE